MKKRLGAIAALSIVSTCTDAQVVYPESADPLLDEQQQVFHEGQRRLVEFPSLLLAKDGAEEKEKALPKTSVRPPWKCTYRLNQPTPVCDSEIIAEEHRHNAEIMEILPELRGEMRKVLKLYEDERERYEEVAGRAHLPAPLVAAIHYREASMDFGTYFHNGQPLGKPTTRVPKGVFFEKGDWKDSALHVLGEDIVDDNGRPSFIYKKRRRLQLGIDENTRDLGRLMTFAEYYNGMRHRYNEFRSCYIYSGSDIPCRDNPDTDWHMELNSSRLGVGLILKELMGDRYGAD